MIGRGSEKERGLDRKGVREAKGLYIGRGSGRERGAFHELRHVCVWSTRMKAKLI